MIFKKFFARPPEPEPQAYTVPAGERVYAIGDIHGRRDCLDTLIGMIDADDAARGRADTKLVLLGDLVDRGADSRGVIERAMHIAKSPKTVLLMGNHEEILIRAWEGDRKAAGLFHRVGGRETLLSYGVSEADYDACDFDDLASLIAAHIPVEHIAFLRNFIDQWQCGDYLFVHAGIRPGLPLEDQRPSDMRWIRREFLDDPRDHGVMVVHGHSITEDVEERPNRIGIDTGAFASGKLTALGIEGTEKWILST
jgi:serine/threonine protein phosphatase 1